MNRNLVWMFALALGTSGPAHALQVNPMEQVLQLADEAKAQTFEVFNNSKTRVAVEVKVFRRNFDDQNAELRVPSDDFSIFPSQLNLAPGEKRLVRVSLKASSEGWTREQAYRVSFEQLPIEFTASQTKNQKTSLKMVFHYVASLYLQPADVKPKIEMGSFQVLAAQKARLVVRNLGSAHALVKIPELRIEDSKTRKTFTVKASELKGFDLENVLAGQNRSFEVTVPATLPPGIYKVLSEAVIED